MNFLNIDTMKDMLQEIEARFGNDSKQAFTFCKTSLEFLNEVEVAIKNFNEAVEECYCEIMSEEEKDFDTYLLDALARIIGRRLV